MKMEKSIIVVEGMSCSHCEDAVKGAVGAIDGDEKESDDISLVCMRREFEEQGYEVA